MFQSFYTFGGGGALFVNNSGSSTAANFNGNYVTSNFALSSDGANGTVLNSHKTWTEAAAATHESK